jgi:hypothetical protein
MHHSPPDHRRTPSERAGRRLSWAGLIAVAFASGAPFDGAYAGGSTGDSTTLTVNGSPGAYTLTAEVVGSGTTAPTGSVQFVDSSTGTVLGSGALVHGGVAYRQTTVATGDGPSASAAFALTSGGASIAVAAVNTIDNTVTVVLTGTGGPVAAAGSPVAVGNAPFAIAAGDFNGDGNTDLAIANIGDGTVTILLGNGVGGFSASAASPIQVGGAPSAIAAADFNGDGRLDLVVTDAVSASATILLGDGHGSFAPTSTSPLPVGELPLSITAADFNGSGYPGFAVANVADNTVSVWLGAQGGLLSAAPSGPLAVGDGPSAIVAADVTGNGHQDLAVTNGVDNTLSVLLGQGNGTFVAASGSPIAVGNDPTSVAVGDLTGNGVADIAIANTFDGTVSLLLGAGNGTFTPAPSSPLYVGSNPTGIQIADLTGRGTEDIAVVNTSLNLLTLLLSVPVRVAVLPDIAVPGVGAQLVVANYSGDTTYAASSSNSVSVVGSGQTTVAVPNVVGDAQAVGAAAITAAGLTVGTLTQQPSGTVALGNIVGESPAAGARVAAGSAVHLFVSSGPGTCAELALVKAAFGSSIGQPNYNPKADVNDDGVVNVLDLSIVARALPAGTICN